MSETERTLVEQEWFHGVLPREEVVRLLRADGDYLVRETTRNHARQLVLSVCWGQHKHFIVQTTPEVCIHVTLFTFGSFTWHCTVLSSFHYTCFSQNYL